jgi:hypothetical protein
MVVRLGCQKPTTVAGNKATPKIPMRHSATARRIAFSRLAKFILRTSEHHAKR